MLYLRNGVCVCSNPPKPNVCKERELWKVPRSKVGPLRDWKPCAKTTGPCASRLVRKWAASRQLPKILTTTFTYLHHAYMQQVNIFLDVFEVPCISQPLSTTFKPNTIFENDLAKSGVFELESNIGNGAYMEQAHAKSACTFIILPCQHVMMVTQCVWC